MEEDLYASIVRLQQFWTPCVHHGQHKFISQKQYHLQQHQPPFTLTYPLESTSLCNLFIDETEMNTSSLAYGMIKFLQEQIIQSQLPCFLIGPCILYTSEVMKQFYSTNLKHSFDHKSIAKCLDVLLEQIILQQIKMESLSSTQLLELLCRLFFFKKEEQDWQSNFLQFYASSQNDSFKIVKSKHQKELVKIIPNASLQSTWQFHLLEKYFEENQKYSIQWSHIIPQPSINSTTSNKITLVPMKQWNQDDYSLDYLYYHHIIPIPSNQILENCTTLEFNFASSHLILFQKNVHTILVNNSLLHAILLEFFKYQHNTLQFSSKQVYQQLLQCCYQTNSKDQIILERIANALKEIPNLQWTKEMGIQFFETSHTVLKLCFSIHSFFFI